MNQNLNERNSTEEEESIFNESDFSTGAYDKYVKNARNAILVVAATQLVFGVFIVLSGSKNEDILTLATSLCVIVLISVIFFSLGLWTKKKPYTAILSALIFYAALVLIDAVYEPMSLFKGIIVKICIIIYLVKGLRDARDAQRWKETFSK